MERDFLAILGSRGGGTPGPPIEYDDKFAFEAQSAVVQPSILQVLRPSDRLGDFTVVRASDASYTDSSGVIQTAPDNVARIDYTNGVAELLTEPQSTNLVTYSEDFSDASWEASGSDVTPNVEISPDETINADLLDVTGTSGGLYHNANVTENTTYTWSFYVKLGTQVLPKLAIYNNSTPGFIISDVDYAATTDSWSRIEYTFDTPVACSSIRCYVQRSTPGLGTSYLWGAQLEELPYATSYIPTNGSTVTRLQDVITDGGNVNVINSEEGTMFFEGSALFDDTGENRYLSLSDGTENNVINISYNDTGALAQFLIYAGGALILTHAQPAVDITTNAKIAVKWKVNDFAIWINGVEVDTVLSGVVPTGLNSVNLSNAIGANYFNSRTRELKIYDRALTDEELEQITTI